MSNPASRRLSLFGVCLLAIFAIPSLSVASAAPIVTTGAATDLTLNTATANGTVDPNGGGTTTVKVEYGKSILYGTTKTVTTVSGSGAIPISSILSGLEVGATYHYRVKAENSGGTAVGGDQSFEMLLQWKVDGKPAAEKAAEMGKTGVNFWVNSNNLEASSLIFKRSGLLYPFEILCKQAWPSHGTLGSSYVLAYQGCEAFYNGSHMANCNPQPSTFTLELDSALVPAKGTAFKTGSKCGLGPEMPITAGFELGSLSPEALKQNVTLVDHMSNVTVTLTNMTWGLESPFNTFKFGIS